jgi:hypothetical protein
MAEITPNTGRELRPVPLEVEDEEDLRERRQDFRRHTWGTVHHLAYVFMSLALVEEGYVSERELRRVARMLPEYHDSPTLPEGLCRQVKIAFLKWIGTAVLADVDNHGITFQMSQFAGSVDYLSKTLSPKRLGELLNDVLEFLHHEPSELQRDHVATLQAGLDLAGGRASPVPETVVREAEDARRLSEWDRLHHLAYLCVALLAVGEVVVDETLEVAMVDVLHRWGEDDGVSREGLVEILLVVETAFAYDMAVDGTARILPSMISSNAEFSHEHERLYNDLDALVTSRSNSYSHREALEAMREVWQASAHACPEEPSTHEGA